MIKNSLRYIQFPWVFVVLIVLLIAAIVTVPARIASVTMPDQRCTYQLDADQKHMTITNCHVCSNDC